MDPIVRLEGVSYSYEPSAPEPLWAVQDMDLAIAPGEYLAVVGHNGSGKSTLARLLNGLLVPTRGEVWVGPWNTRQALHRRDVRACVGMVFQVPDNQIIATTVEDDVAFGPENLGVPEAELQPRVEEALRAVGLWERRSTPPHQLSAGEKQRLAIAGVLAMRPRCLVLDEATALLDGASRADVLATVRRLHAEGVAIVAITHRLQEAAEADRLLVLDHGRCALLGHPRNILTDTDALARLGLEAPEVPELAARLRRRGFELPPGLLTPGELAEVLAGQKALSR
ncbi:MAG: energy-coupling factor transporter ATPase [Anaerolineae bacterium]